jgi:hypothetical protein
MASATEGWQWDNRLRRDVYPIDKDEIGWTVPLDSGHPSAVWKWLTAPENQARIQHHLTRYFTADYAGRHFEWFSSRGRGAHFSPWHVLAIESLSARLPSQTVRWLLEPDEERDGLLDRLQSIATAGTSLWECDLTLLREGGELSDLYDMLKTKEGFGHVTTSKLMAAKFPRLVPIRDSMVEALLGMEEQTNWWEPIRKLFVEADGSLVSHLNEKFEIPDEIGGVTTLRRLDVILWMESRARQMSPRRTSSAEHPTQN